MWAGRPASAARRSRCAGSSSIRRRAGSSCARAASESRSAYETTATLALAHPAVGFELTPGWRRSGWPRPAAPGRGGPADVGLGARPGRHPGSRAVRGRGRSGFPGFIQRPGDAGPTGRRTQLFVNGRPFRDSFLLRAAEAGYRSAIHPGDRPSLFLRVGRRPGRGGRQRPPVQARGALPRPGGRRAHRGGRGAPGARRPRRRRRRSATGGRCRSAMTAGRRLRVRRVALRRRRAGRGSRARTPRPSTPRRRARPTRSPAV